MEQEPIGCREDDAADLLRLGLTQLRTYTGLTQGPVGLQMLWSYCVLWPETVQGARGAAGHHALTQGTVPVHKAEQVETVAHAQEGE